MAAPETEKRKLWVRAGGRCTLCKRYLLEGNLSYKEVSIGEAAHIVGEKHSEKSARGLDPLPEPERNLAENLLLACPDCHTEIDNLLVAELIDKKFLHDRKREHENEVFHQTSLTSSRRTVIIRMVGNVRGAHFELPRDAAVEAVISSGGRFPVFPQAYDLKSIEIDLRDVAGEQAAGQDYYRAATNLIDNAIDRRIAPGLSSGEIQHMSIFAIARLPLLIYFGAKLDDGVTTEVYQRHRSTQKWIWPAERSTALFEISQVSSGPAGGDVALITNLSGTTPIDDLPEKMSSSTIFRLDVVPDPSEDVFTHPGALTEFEALIRTFFTRLENTHKSARRIHLFGAMPISPAVTLGKILKGPHLRPILVIYDRTGDGYVEALEV